MSEIDFGYWREKGSFQRRYRITWDQKAKIVYIRDIVAKSNILQTRADSEEEARSLAKDFVKKLKLEGDFSLYFQDE